MAETKKHALNIFLSYAHEDEVSVRKLHKFLCDNGFDVWFDKDKLVGGQDWQREIQKGLNKSDIILICLSKNSVARPGFVQREFKFALDRALEMPEGRIFLIPVRLEQVDEEEIPQRIRHLHWVDLFQKNGNRRLMKSLSVCAEELDRLAVEEPRMEEINSLNLENNNEHELQKDISVAVDDSLQDGIIADNGNEFQANGIEKVDQEPSINEKISVEQDAKPEEQIIADETEHITNREIDADLDKMKEAEKGAPVSPSSEQKGHAQFPAKKKASATLQTVIGITLLGILCLCGSILALYFGSSVASVFSSINQRLTVEAALTPSIPSSTQKPAKSPVPTIPSDVVPQGGLGDELLRTNTWAYVVIVAATDGCGSPNAADTAITVTQEQDSAGVWKEQWLVACDGGKNVPVDVVFTPNATSGGTDINVTKGE